MSEPFRINRAPVLTLWAAVVGERLVCHARGAGLRPGGRGHERVFEGRAPGIYAPPAERPHEPPPPKPAGVTGAIRDVPLLGRIVHVGETKDGRARSRKARS
jgi:hypothetical protein